MDPTVPVGGTRKEAGPTVRLGENLCLREELGQEWSLCAIRDKFVCREEVWLGWVPLYH